jgi:hypothetical protein
MSNYGPPTGAGWPPPDGEQNPVPNPWTGQAPGQYSGPEVLSHRDEHEHNRRRVVVVIAAVVATLGAVLGVAFSGVFTSTAPGRVSAANIDPPASPTASLRVPADPNAQSSAQAQASAMAAAGTFSPPATVPGDVPGYSGSLQASIPAGLTVQVPSVHAKDQTAQSLADQASEFLRAWAEAWATDNVNDPKYRAWCVDGCHGVTDPVVTLWSNAKIHPAGTLTFTNLAGGTANGGASGEVGVCLDDSGLFAVTSVGQSGFDPYPQGGPVLYVFGAIFDKAVNHWVITSGYTSPGDAYCTQSDASS